MLSLVERQNSFPSSQTWSNCIILGNLSNQTGLIKLAKVSIGLSQCFLCCSAIRFLWGCDVPFGLLVLAALSLPRPGSDTIISDREDGSTILGQKF